MKPFASLDFGQRFATLPRLFHRRVDPQSVPQPELLAVNRPLLLELGVDPASLAVPASLDVLAGNRVLPGMQPLASCYSGHQFGQYVAQLGDGRALLLGDTPWGEVRAEWQLKGAGMTPYSRMGDGRAVLRSSLREYLCSEAMHALGIPTTRALALTASPVQILREEPETAGVVTRIAESFLRFGHFELAYHRGDVDATRALAGYLIEHHYPEYDEAEHPALALFQAIVDRTARLMADWQSVGFCHGVMNTDNMSVLGLTLDYGPFGFMDAFDAGHVCNHSDYAGRYAYRLQPQVGLWNLHCLGSAFLPLASEAQLIGVLDSYRECYESAWLERMRRKLGWQGEETADVDLLQAMFDLMQEQSVDFTLFFRELAASHHPDGLARWEALFRDPAAARGWQRLWQQRATPGWSTVDERVAAMNRVNPRFVLRNHLCEMAIRAVRDTGDVSVLTRLIDCLARPFDEQPGNEDLAALPPDWAKDLTVSCSS